MPITNSVKFANSFTGTRNPNKLVIAVGCFLSLLVLLSWVWFGVRERFPLLAEGVYIGSIQPKNGELRSWLVYQREDGSKLVALRLWKDGVSEWVQIPVSSSAAQDRLKLSTEEGNVQFSGHAKDGKYVGRAQGSDELSGNWELRLVNDFRYHDVTDSKSDRYWLDLAAEFVVLQNKVSNLSGQITKISTEREQIETALTDTRALKKDGDERLRQTKAEQEALQKQLQERRAMLKAMENKMFLSQRITARGKLVSLAREGLQRERRWAESLERSGGAGRSQDMMEAYERGKNILELRRLIDLERSRIYRLQGIYDRRQGGPKYQENPYGGL